MSKEVKISSINVEIGEQNIKLTIEDAKKLKEVLDDIFGKTTEIKFIETEKIVEKYPYYQPYITWSSDRIGKYDYETFGDNTGELTCKVI